MSFRLGLAQMLVEGGQPAANLDRAAHAVHELASQGADLVLLPEAMNLGWTHPSCHELAECIPGGVTCQRLCQLAREHQIHVVTGLVERDGSTIYNAAVLIAPDGQVILRHHKIHELEIAHDCYQRGRSLQVVDTALGRLGVMICADGFATHLPIARSLGAMGAEFILSPCAWAVPPEHDNHLDPYGKVWFDSYGPVCGEYELWIAGCSNVGPIIAGPWEGRRCIGCSLVMGPEQAVAYRGPYGEVVNSLVQLG